MNRRTRRVAQVCNEIAEKKVTLENAIEMYNLTKTEQSMIGTVMERMKRLGKIGKVEGTVESGGLAL